jgi:hypothetical protein
MQTSVGNGESGMMFVDPGTSGPKRDVRGSRHHTSGNGRRG